MAFTYKSNVTAMKFALKECKHELCQGIGVLAVAEVKPITPVNKNPKAPTRGNLKKSIVSEVMENDEGVYIGATVAAPYAEIVEKGSSRQTAQPYLEPGCLNAIPKIVNVAQKLYKQKIGDK